MRIVGIIAEYDPFHRGHAWQLEEAKRLSGAEAAVVVMSAAFTQRGAAAMLPPHDRAEMALRCGADLVIALPALWAVRDAEHFALAGVHILHSLGCDAISFGAETADNGLLCRTAEMIERPTAELEKAVREGLERGLPHPAALAGAVAQADEEAGEVLQTPNNTLAVCYLRAMLRLNAGMEAYPVQRVGSYHASSIAEDLLPSASAIRAAVRRGDLLAAEKAMPDAAAAILHQALLDGRMTHGEVLDAALLYRLRTMSGAEYAALPSLSEGLEDRLRRAAGQAASTEELLQLAASRRYPAARLRRLCAHALLQITQKDVEDMPLPPAALVLGFREDKQALLSQLSKGRIPLLTRSAQYPAENGWLAVEKRAWDIQALAMGSPAGQLFTHGMLRL